MIKISGKVIAIDAASRFADKRQRVTISIEEAPAFFSVIKIPHDGEFELDQEVKIFLCPQQR